MSSSRRTLVSSSSTWSLVFWAAGGGLTLGFIEGLVLLLQGHGAGMRRELAWGIIAADLVLAFPIAWGLLVGGAFFLEHRRGWPAQAVRAGLTAGLVGAGWLASPAARAMVGLREPSGAAFLGAEIIVLVAAIACGMAVVWSARRLPSMAPARLGYGWPIFLGLLFFFSRAWARAPEEASFVRAAGLRGGFLVGLMGLAAGLLRSRRPGPLRLAVLGLIGVVFGLVGLPGGKDLARPSADAEPPFILLLTADTMRADALGCYGAPPERTPHLDQLAADGFLFEDAWVPSPWTKPSFGSILTGLDPDVHLARGVKDRLPEAAPTLAERLKAAGYVTAAFVENPFLRPTAHFTQGFDRYENFPRGRGAPSLGEIVLARLAPRGSRWRPPSSDQIETAIDLIAAHRRAPFFLWLHIFDPHMPYEPGERYLPPREERRGLPTRFVRRQRPPPDERGRQWVRRLYEAEVRSVDDRVSRLMAALKRWGLYEQGLIIFTSDHGEEFWEHGGFEHGHTLYGELLRAPLIIKPAGRPASGRIVDPVSLTDLTPTLLELCGLPFDAETLNGRSLAGFLRGAAPPPQARYAGALLYGADREMLEEGGFKYIGPSAEAPEQLFELSVDPGERRSVIADRPELAGRFRQALEERRARSEALRARHGLNAPEPVPLDAETERRLRALGYLR